MVNQAPVSLKVSPDCWRFIEEARSWDTPVPLADDVHAILNRAPHVEIRGPLPEPRFIVHLTRPQAQAMQQWLHSVHECLKHDDERRLKCLLSISRLAVALMLSER